jgi:osmotically-inducible protein OsmY
MLATTCDLIANTPDDDLQRRVRLFVGTVRPELARLTVHVDAGTVHLSGMVSSYYVWQLALSAAGRVAGVRHLVDDIDVMLPRQAPSNTR